MRDTRAFLVWEEALRFVRARDLDGVAGVFAPEGVVELPLPLPGMPRPDNGREELRSVLAPVWRAQREQGERRDSAPGAEGFDTVVLHETHDPEVVVIEFDVQGVESSGMPYRLSYVHVVAVRDGRIATLRDDVDPGAVRRRMKAPGGDGNKALVRRYFDLCDAGDIDRIGQLLASDYVDHTRPEVPGPAGIAARSGLLAASPGASETIDTLVADGDLVAARTTLRRTRAGVALVTSGMSFFRVRDGKLAEQWSCYPFVA
jgi:ketosteroid isomerase-like protein